MQKRTFTDFGKTLMERRAVLETIIKPAAGIQLGNYVEDEGKALFNLTRTKGMEGIVAKRKIGLYRPGKRSPDWLKIKSRPQQEFVVGGFTEGKGRRVAPNRVPRLAGRHEGEGSCLGAVSKNLRLQPMQGYFRYPFCYRRATCAPNKTASPGVISSVFSSSSSGCQWDYYRWTFRRFKLRHA